MRNCAEGINEQNNDCVGIDRMQFELNVEI
jgi:hypothetical protein